MRTARESNSQASQNTSSPRVLSGVQGKTVSVLDPQYTLLTSVYSNTLFSNQLKWWARPESLRILPGQGGRHTSALPNDVHIIIAKVNNLDVPINFHEVFNGGTYFEFMLVETDGCDTKLLLKTLRSDLSSPRTIHTHLMCVCVCVRARLCVYVF